MMMVTISVMAIVAIMIAKAADVSGKINLNNK
jgi:hypothetical protein